MKKKGFTLVELLAVIAILAILVIMALPAVLRMFSDARKNSFENEVKTVFNNAQERFVMDSISMTNGSYKWYADDGTDGATGADASHAKKLDIQNGSGTFKYCVIIKNNGDIVSIKVSNGTYSYSGTNVANASAITSDSIMSGNSYAAVSSSSDCSIPE